MISWLFEKIKQIDRLLPKFTKKERVKRPKSIRLEKKRERLQQISMKFRTYHYTLKTYISQFFKLENLK